VARPDPDRIRKWGHLAGIGPLLVASVLVGYLIGTWLDSKLGTSPWLLVLGVLLGTAAGFVNLVRLLQNLGETGKKQGRSRGRSPGGSGDGGGSGT
jgi:ATP synthase protein I